MKIYRGKILCAIMDLWWSIKGLFRKIMILDEVRYDHKEGEWLPPFYYGLAYRRWDMDYDVFYPIPLNYVVRLGMFIMHKWNRFRSRPTWVDRQMKMEIGKREADLNAQRWMYDDLIGKAAHNVQLTEMELIRKKDSNVDYRRGWEDAFKRLNDAVDKRMRRYDRN